MQSLSAVPRNGAGTRALRSRRRNTRTRGTPHTRIEAAHDTSGQCCQTHISAHGQRRQTPMAKRVSAHNATLSQVNADQVRQSTPSKSPDGCGSSPADICGYKHQTRGARRRRIGARMPQVPANARRRVRNKLCRQIPFHITTNNNT